jgi:hypothetical protein
MLERNLLMNIPWVFNYDYSACIEWPEPRYSSLYVQRINIFYRSWEEEREEEEEKKSCPPLIVHSVLTCMQVHSVKKEKVGVFTCIVFS